MHTGTAGVCRWATSRRVGKLQTSLPRGVGCQMLMCCCSPQHPFPSTGCCRAPIPLSHPKLLPLQHCFLRIRVQKIVFSPGNRKMQVSLQPPGALVPHPWPTPFLPGWKKRWAVPGNELMSSLIERKQRLTGNHHWQTILLCSPTTWTNLGMSGCLLLENQAIPSAMEITKRIFQCLSCVGSVTPNASPLRSRRVSGDFSVPLLWWGNAVITEITPPLSNQVGTSQQIQNLLGLLVHTQPYCIAFNF